MSTSAIKTLLIEDNAGDARLMAETLAEVRDVRFDMKCVGRLSEGLDRLASEEVDVVLLDLFLPDGQGIDTFLRAHRQAPEVPIVVLTGYDDENMAVQAMHEGAQDYLVKGRLDRNLLLRSIRYAMERNQMLERLNQSVRERAAQAAELERSNERLQELDRMKSEFVSVVSHELRTPLTSIRAAISLLGDGCLGKLNEEQKEYIDLVQRNLDRLESLVLDVLNISRIESGRLQIDLLQADLRHLASDVVQMLAPQAKARQCALTAGVPENARFARCDPDKITQVLVNLVGNAIKHNPERIRIGISAARDENRIRVTVSDNGIGIPLEDQPRIFERFYQVRRQSGGGSQGTGLGLAISRGLVEAHGGKLRLASEAGKGTAFSFDLEAVEVQTWEKGRSQTWELEGLTVTAEQYGDRVRLLLCGRIEETNFPRLTRVTQEILERWGNLLVIDLSECLYMDSRGIGHLIELRARAAEHGGDLAIVHVQPRLRKILDSLGISKAIACHSDLTVALGCLRPSNPPQ
ncbi:MAG: response regulator [Planctomycetes bacterium]|nr:response regulator [Planctomycetota bacterium]